MLNSINRRTFCGLAVALSTCNAGSAYEARGMIVHLRQPLGARAYAAGEVVHDPQCGRHFLVTKVLETPTCRLAKAQWVVPAAQS